LACGPGKTCKFRVVPKEGLSPKYLLLRQLSQNEVKRRRYQEQLREVPVWRFRRKRKLTRRLIRAEVRETAAIGLLAEPEVNAGEPSAPGDSPLVRELAAVRHRVSEYEAQLSALSESQKTAAVELHQELELARQRERELRDRSRGA